MPVIWEPYLEIPNIASDADIRQVEEVLGVRFPADYRAVLQAHQGQMPEPSDFKVGRGNDVLSCLLHATPSVRDNQYHLLSGYEIIRDYLPPTVFPIAETPGGNKICLDYRTSSDAPVIIHWNHELDEDQAITLLAPSFTDFLAKLYDLDHSV